MYFCARAVSQLPLLLLLLPAAAAALLPAALLLLLLLGALRLLTLLALARALPAGLDLAAAPRLAQDDLLERAVASEKKGGGRPACICLPCLACPACSACRACLGLPACPLGWLLGHLAARPPGRRSVPPPCGSRRRRRRSRYCSCCCLCYCGNYHYNYFLEQLCCPPAALRGWRAIAHEGRRSYCSCYCCYHCGHYGRAAARAPRAHWPPWPASSACSGWLKLPKGRRGGRGARLAALGSPG
jgi:hypothetical protein